MRRHVTAMTCAVALAAACGVVSAEAQQAPTQKAGAENTISGCLERNAYDQYVLRSSSGSSGTTASNSGQHRLLLQTDLDLTQDLGKRVQVTGHVLDAKQMRADVGHTRNNAVGTTGETEPGGTVFGVVAVQPGSGDCGPNTTQR